MKILFEFGHQIINGRGTGVHGAGDEAVEAKKLGVDIAKYLHKSYGIMAIADRDDWSLPETSRKLAEIAEPDDLLVSFHFNAFNRKVSGTEVFIPKRHTRAEYELADKTSTVIATTLSINNRGVKTEDQSQHNRLEILSGWPAHATNMLIEVCFIDNPTDWRLYQTHYKELVRNLSNLFYQHTEL